MAEFLLSYSAKLGINLNDKGMRGTHQNGRTGFIVACEKGHSNLVELLMRKSAELGIDLNAKLILVLQYSYTTNNIIQINIIKMLVYQDS